MMGFATIDIDGDNNVTVWLTNRDGRTEVGHGNAVVFRAAEDYDDDLVEQVVANRLMVLSPRTKLEHLPFDCRGVDPVDLAPLVEATLDAQEVLQAAFEERRTLKGKEDLVEPTRLSVMKDLPPDWASASSPTLVIANRVASLWRAWLHTENERVKRKDWMPAGFRSKDLQELPGEFALNVEPLAKRVYR